MPLNPRINTSVWAPLSLPSHPCFPFQSLVSVKPNKHFPLPRILFIGSALNWHLTASQAPTNYLLNNSRKLQKNFPSNVLEVPQTHCWLIRYALKYWGGDICKNSKKIGETSFMFSGWAEKRVVVNLVVTAADKEKPVTWSLWHKLSLLGSAVTIVGRLNLIKMVKRVDF